MKVLVTGGAGFIGAHLVERLLVNGYRVEIFDKKQDQDINNWLQLSRVVGKNKFDVIIHLAAEAGVRRSFKQPQLYFKTNVGGTLNILECLRLSPKTRLILASSSSVYGNNAVVPFRETETNLVPISPYATSKRSAELAVQIYAQHYGIKITILRFFTVYGPRNRQDMAAFTFTRDISLGKPIKLFGKNTSRDFTYIDDIVAGIIQAVEKPLDFEIINLGNSQPVRVTKFIKTIETALGKKARVGGEKLPKGDVDQTYADISKAKKLLGWQPKTDLKAGVEKLVEWFRLR